MAIKKSEIYSKARISEITSFQFSRNMLVDFFSHSYRLFFETCSEAHANFTITKKFAQFF